MLQSFRETNFKKQLDKSEFLRRKVAYLGLVTPDGVKPNPNKQRKKSKGFVGL